MSRSDRSPSKAPAPVAPPPDLAAANVASVATVRACLLELHYVVRSFVSASCTGAESTAACADVDGTLGEASFTIGALAETYDREEWEAVAFMLRELHERMVTLADAAAEDDAEHVDRFERGERATVTALETIAALDRLHVIARGRARRPVPVVAAGVES